MNKDLAAELDLPDVQCDSATEYWHRHEKIALQSLHMAFNNLDLIINNVHSESLHRILRQVSPMVERFAQSSSDRQKFLQFIAR